MDTPAKTGRRRREFPISAKLVADLLTVAGVDRVLTMELHAGRSRGSSTSRWTTSYSSSHLCNQIRGLIPHDNAVIVSPDAGGVERARAVAKLLDAGLAIIDKRRSGPNVAEVMHLIGDVEGKTAILVDDMIDTAGTLTKAAKAVMDQGAEAVYAVATHPVLSGPAVERIVESPLEEGGRHRHHSSARSRQGRASSMS